MTQCRRNLTFALTLATSALAGSVCYGDDDFSLDGGANGIGNYSGQGAELPAQGGSNLIDSSSDSPVEEPLSGSTTPSGVMTMPATSGGFDGAGVARGTVPANVANANGLKTETSQTAQSQRNDFPGVSAMPGIRRDLSPGEAPEIYTVQEGDTMFDICDQLISDGSYWPKLWALNTDVKNPHFIYPGVKLAFYAGDTENPPKIEVVSEDEMVPVEKGDVSEVELVSQSDLGLERGSEGRSVKVVQGIEEQSPVSVIGPSDVVVDAGAADGIIFAGRVFSSNEVDVVLPAMIVADEIDGVGEVVSGESGERLAGDDKKIIVRLSGGSQGGTYSVLRPSGMVSSSRTNDRVGYRYEFSGNIRTVRSQKDGLFEAVVFDARVGVSPGDILVNFMSTRRKIPMFSQASAVSAVESSVIGFSENGKATGGSGDLVYLEKGGLSPGGYYGIFKAEQMRDMRHLPEDVTQSSRQMIAVAKVIEISGEAALGVLLDVRTEVRTGDTLYPP